MPCSRPLGPPASRRCWRGSAATGSDFPRRGRWGSGPPTGATPRRWGSWNGVGGPWGGGRARGVRAPLWGGRGSSDPAATFGRYAIEAAARVPVSLVAPSLIARYGVEPRVRDWLVVAASQ